MDLTILIGVATALLVILVSLFLVQNRKPKTEQNRQQRQLPVRNQDDIPRRAQIARNQRNRLRQNVADVQDDVEDEDLPQPTPGHVIDEKAGTKKRAKMEAKEQKRLLREQELKIREERKVQEEKMEVERKRQEEQEAEIERKKADAERLAREEQERKEHEEYLKMKEAFSVEEEGFEENDDEKENLLADFIQYIKNNKVVVLEELAAEFKLKTQQVIERIQELQENGTLTGVVDDRGKFIYVSKEELLSVAKFIKQRGRVSITELAESSNKLINLTPVATV